MSVGTQIAGYRLEELVGRGGMGVVYRAHDVALERSVALKLLSPSLAEDRDFRERFLVESRLAAALEHPNVVPIHDAGEADGQLYLAMRYVEGTDLKRLLQDDGPLEPARAIAICAQVAEALDAAHARGLVHRDVKPSNVLLDEREHAYLADFGLTRRLTDAAPDFDAGLSLGTPAYVAPEQIEGKEVDGRADQYSLACMLCECLSGEPPFARGSEAATLFAHLEEAPPAPAGLESVIPKAMAKDPADRYPSCRAFLADARSALGLEPRRARWPLAVAGVGAALIGAALLAFLLTRGDGAVQPTTTGRLVRIDGSTGAVKQTIRVGDRPAAVAVGSGAVWIASPRANTVWRVDRAAGVVRSITGIQEPHDLAVAGSVVYVVTPNAIARIDADISAVQAPVAEELRCGSTAIGAGPAGLWIADAGSCETNASGRAGSRDLNTNLAERLSPGSDAGGVVVDQIPIPRRRDEEHDLAQYSDLAVGTGIAWVIGDSFDQAIWRLDAGTHSSASIALPGAPLRVAVGAGGIWVTSLLDDRVWRVDPVMRRVVAVIPVGRGSSGVAVAGGSVWVANAIDGTVSRIDPRTNEVRSTIDVGGYVPALAADGHDVWVTADDS